MSTVNSQQKIDGFNAITKDFSLFMLSLSEASTKIKSAADTIAVPAISSTASAILAAVKSANELCTDTSEDMKAICETWAERQGFGETARAAFEDCKSAVSSISGNVFTVPAVEPCDGLHENVTDETVSAFKAAIEDFSEIRRQFIDKIAEAKEEYATPDTTEVFNNIGKGIEQFTNGFVEALESHKADLTKFGIALDESIEKVKSQSSNITATGAAAKAKIANLEGDLD